MKHLFIARHGEYDGIDLSEKGRTDIKNLAVKITGIASPSLVISSDVPRAMQSAGILSQEFGLPSEAIIKHICFYNFNSRDGLDLYDGNRLCRSVYQLMKLIDGNQEGNTGIAVVTHGEFSDFFADFFTELHFNTTYGGRLDKSQAYHINMDKRRRYLMKSENI